MNKNVTIYYKAKKIILINQLPVATELNKIFVDFSENEVSCCLKILDESKVETVYILSEDYRCTIAVFANRLNYIIAAGGIVKNNNNEILMIYRRGAWDLPKGKLEKNEDIESCALREVEEETGVTDLKLLDKIGSSFHIYFMFGSMNIKESIWYNMTSNCTVFTPQTDEGIEQVKWINTNDLDVVFKNTYGNIIELLSKNF